MSEVSAQEKGQVKGDPVSEIVKEGQLYEVLPDGRWAFFFDHHLINSFNTCEKYFYYKHRLRLRGKGPKGKALSLGSWWSSVMEYFYLKIQEEQSSAPHLSTSFGGADKNFIMECAARAWKEHEMETWKTWDEKGYDSFGGQSGALLMAHRYYESYGDLDRQNFQIIAAEQGYGRRKEVPVGENDSVVVYYIGKPDLVVYAKHEKIILPIDHKTVDKIGWDTQRKYKPHAQTAGYVYTCNLLAKELGYETPVDRCVINVAARSEPTDKPRDGKPKPRFTRVYPAYTQEEIKEWQGEILFKAARLRQCIEQDYWPKREASCHIYTGCEFRAIDSLTPSAREIAIKADYIQIDPWSPYKLQEEENGNS